MGIGVACGVIAQDFCHSLYSKLFSQFERGSLENSCVANRVCKQCEGQLLGLT